MSLSTNVKQQIEPPLFYTDEFDDKDLKVRLNANVVTKELSLADLLISGFIRRNINIGHVPMIAVSVTAKMLNKSAHLPKIIQEMIPMKKIFNKEVMDLKTPKFSDLSRASRTVLRIFLQWRLNTSTDTFIYGSPKTSLKNVILSGNNQHFGYDGCFFLKQVLPYHPEIVELLIDRNNIDDNGLLLIIQSLPLRHDDGTVKSRYPIKLLQIINLANNNFSDKYIGQLLQSLLVYTPYLREIDLSSNNLKNSCLEAICHYLESINAKRKKQRCLRKIILRHNQINFDGVMQLNKTVKGCHYGWNFKIELGSNPTKQLYIYEASQTMKIDPRINLYGA